MDSIHQQLVHHITTKVSESPLPNRSEEARKVIGLVLEHVPMTQLILLCPACQDLAQALRHEGLREALENRSDSRDNDPVNAGQDWSDGWQAARLLGLRADHGQEADQAGEVSR